MRLSRPRQWLLAAALCIASAFAPAAAARERALFDAGWRFAFGHAADPAKDFGHGTRPFFFGKAGFGDGPAAPDFNDSGWRRLDLPHDWAVELPFDARASTNHGSKAIGRAFPENSVGWYRRELPVTAADLGRRIALEFDGVFRDSVVWVNGHFIGREPSGYSGFRYDITDYLNYGGRNVVAVRVDASGEEGWWYEGAGIYRHIWLSKTDALHVAPSGTFVRSKVDGPRAELTVDVDVRNDGPASAAFSVEHELRDPDGRVVARRTQGGLAVQAASGHEVQATIPVPAPRLWSLETPQLYTLTTRIRRSGQVVDSVDTRVGIRSIRFDPVAGFFLNGKHVKLHGVNNHQDHAGVGVALPDRLHEFRFQRLKAMGVNAYRSAHHPATPELLDAADRMGILVIDEHRMMGTTPQIRSELERLVRRGRNHPSVILWSVGNEEWMLEYSAVGTRITREMQAIVRRLDPTRPVTVAATGSGGAEGTPVGSEVLGLNYKAQHDVDAMHKRFPTRPIVVTEEGATHATRGVYVDDRARQHLAAYDKRNGGPTTSSIEEAWRFIAERPFIAGMFVWTGLDYRGETTPFGWPAIGSQFGMLDTTGLLKDSGHYLKSAWTTEPMVHLLPHWNWPGREGQPIDVRVYANTDEVELLLNGRSLGRKALARYAHAAWQVPYAPGTLTARAYRAGQLVASAEATSTGEGAALRLASERTSLQADGADVAVVDVSVLDAQGRRVPTASNGVRFAVSGPVRLIGMGNGDPSSLEADKPAPRQHFHALRAWSVRGAPDEASAMADGSAGWRNPFEWTSDDKAPPDSRFNKLRASFMRPPAAAGERIELLVKEIAPGQRLLVNGQAVAPRHDGEQWIVELDAAALRDDNTLELVLATPARGMRAVAHDADGGARWATLRVTTPAGPWQRRLFNGHAQVIVQSTGQPGTATLTATGDQLQSFEIRIEAR